MCVRESVRVRAYVCEREIVFELDCMNICVCVCVRERERESESVTVLNF